MLPDPTSPLPDDLRAALDDAPEAERAELARVWHLLGRADAPADTDAAWAALRPRLSTDAPRRAPDRAPARGERGLWRRRPVRWAAGAGALVLAAVLAWWAVPVTHTAPAGDQLAVALPDGSEVVLAGGSSVRHARRFGASRDVRLTGEAFFDVASSDVPFVVSTHDATVEVLGTAFNVRAWDDATEVALLHGSVRVSAAETEVLLAPGQAVSTAAETLAPRAADVERAAVWREGGLAFDDAPLATVLRDVERRYGVTIETRPGAPLGTRVSAVYAARPPLDTLLGDLGATAGARFARTARGYEVRGAGTGG